MREAIEEFQIEACRATGYTELMGDPAFPLSGDYRAPEALQRDLAFLLDSWNVLSPWPPVPEKRIHGQFQEKVTYLFLQAAWHLLEQNRAIQRVVASEHDMFIATAPIGSIEAKVRRTWRKGTNNYAIIFDAGMFFSLYFFIETLAMITKDDESGPSSLRHYGHNLDPNTLTIDPLNPGIHHLADLLLVLMRDGNSFAMADVLQRFPRENFSALFLRDAFCFLVSHEYHHIHQGHFDRNDEQPVPDKEFQADVNAFADTCNTVHSFGQSTMSVHHNVMLMFYFFELVHRTVILKMRRAHYEQLDLRLRHLLHFPDDRHHTPPARRISLNKWVYETADPKPADFPARAGLIESLFDTIWRHVGPILETSLGDKEVHPIWNHYVAAIDAAYTRFANN